MPSSDVILPAWVEGRRARLDGVECAASGAIVASAALVGWLCQRFPAQLPVIAPWEFFWPDYLAIGVALWWYIRGLHRTRPPERPSWPQRTCFFAGLAVIYLVVLTRFLYLAEHMFFLHRVQHLVLHHLGPFLIVLAWPGAVLARGMPGWALRLAGSVPVRRACSLIQQPVLAATLFVGLIVVWLYPLIQLRMMLDSSLFEVADWTMVVDGIFFFWLVLDPRVIPPSRLSYAGRIILALSVQIPQIAIGGLLAVSTGDLYPWYDLCGRVFPAIGPIADQQMGAFVVLFLGGMMSAVAALIVFGRLWRAEEQTKLAGAVPGL